MHGGGERNAGGAVWCDSLRPAPSRRAVSTLGSGRHTRTRKSLSMLGRVGGGCLVAVEAMTGFIRSRGRRSHRVAADPCPCRCAREVLRDPCRQSPFWIPGR